MTSALAAVDKLLAYINALDTIDDDFKYNDMNTDKPVFKQLFGKTHTNEEVFLYTLQNKSGMTVEIITYGGHIRSLKIPDCNGKITDVTIGLDTIQDYEKHQRFFGPIVGRFANRISKGKFNLNGKQYKLAINNGPNALHGGCKGFDKRVWIVKQEMENMLGNEYECGIQLCLKSEHMDEGYPSSIEVLVTYLLMSTCNTLEIRYEAVNVGNLNTILNLTNHSYWNLNGNFKENSIVDGSHLIQLNADCITAVDDTCIPTGELMFVNKTAFDFRKFRSIGEKLDSIHEQMIFGNGYDHNFVINKNKLLFVMLFVLILCVVFRDGEIVECARVKAHPSGIQMVVETDQPGVQFYTGNYLSGKYCGKGFVYKKRCAFCLETQHFPDSPNHSNFPSTVLKSGIPFHSVTKYAFV